MPYKDPERQREAKRLHYEANKAAYKERSKVNHQKHRVTIREWLRSLKDGQSCPHCGEDDPRCLHWHHRDPSKKQCEVSKMVYMGKTRAKIMEEVAKCDLICANCHAKLHSSVPV